MLFRLNGIGLYGLSFCSGSAFIAVGIAMPLSFFYPITIAIFALIAVSSASHDIAADGFYMYALDQHKQAFFVGIRSTFYRFAMLTALGVIPVIAGLIQQNTGLPSVTFEARSVLPEEYRPFNPSEINIRKSEGEPAILLFPKDLQVPVYQAGKSQTRFSCTLYCFVGTTEEGETVVVNVARKSGSKDIDLSKKQTGRFEFTS